MSIDLSGFDTVLGMLGVYFSTAFTLLAVERFRRRLVPKPLFLVTGFAIGLACLPLVRFYWSFLPDSAATMALGGYVVFPFLVVGWFHTHFFGAEPGARTWRRPYFHNATDLVIGSVFALAISAVFLPGHYPFGALARLASTFVGAMVVGFAVGTLYEN